MVETTDLSKTFGPVLPANRASARAPKSLKNGPFRRLPNFGPVIVNGCQY
jgi:hypothetical protein